MLKKAFARSVKKSLRRSKNKSIPKLKATEFTPGTIRKGKRGYFKVVVVQDRKKNDRKVWLRCNKAGGVDCGDKRRKPIKSGDIVYGPEYKHEQYEASNDNQDESIKIPSEFLSDTSSESNMII